MARALRAALTLPVNEASAAWPTVGKATDSHGTHKVATHLRSQVHRHATLAMILAERGEAEQPTTSGLAMTSASSTSPADPGLTLPDHDFWLFDDRQVAKLLYRPDGTQAWSYSPSLKGMPSSTRTPGPCWNDTRTTSGGCPVTASTLPERQRPPSRPRRRPRTRAAETATSAAREEYEQLLASGSLHIPGDDQWLARVRHFRVVA